MPVAGAEKLEAALVVGFGRIQHGFAAPAAVDVGDRGLALLLEDGGVVLRLLGPAERAEDGAESVVGGAELWVDLQHAAVLAFGGGELAVILQDDAVVIVRPCL